MGWRGYSGVGVCRRGARCSSILRRRPEAGRADLMEYTVVCSRLRLGGERPREPRSDKKRRVWSCNNNERGAGGSGDVRKMKFLGSYRRHLSCERALLYTSV